MIRNCLLPGVLLAILTSSPALTKPGGHSPVPVTNKEVIAAANFAVTAQEKVLNDNKKEPKPVKLKLLKILNAEQQVVAGMNYYLNLKVKLNDVEKEADAVVWWQSWRKPDPYRLTSWHWKTIEKAELADKTNNIILLWPKDAKINPAAIKETILRDRGDGHIRVTNIDTPSMQYFPAPNSTQPAPVIILCPGGGYSYLVVSKMTEVATWLNKHGVGAFVLKYRTPKKRAEAFRDAQRAIRIVRSRASEWNIDPGRIGIMGSSAGGHLAAQASTGYNIKTYKESDKIDDASCKPDFTVLLYPAYMNRKDALAPEFTVSSEINPTLIISAKDDKRYFPGSPIYAKALEDAGASIRVHFFEKGGHGFGMHCKAPLSTWPDLFLQWLKDIGILEQKTEQKNASDRK